MCVCVCVCVCVCAKMTSCLVYNIHRHYSSPVYTCITRIALPYGLCVYNNSLLVTSFAHCLQHKCTYLTDKQEMCVDMYIQKCLE